MKQTTQELFDAFRPDLGDQDLYIDDLSKKLDAVEMLHKACEDNARRSRKSIIAAALAGLLLGGFAMAVILMFPSSGIAFSLNLGIKVLSFSIQNYILIFFILAAIPIYLIIILFSGQSDKPFLR